MQTTLQRLRAWLNDSSNFIGQFDHVRCRFVTTNGKTISIQMSEYHYCGMRRLFSDCDPDTARKTGDCNTVEMWSCPHSELLAPYGDGSDPYAYVPLEVVASYIDELESYINLQEKP